MKLTQSNEVQQNQNLLKKQTIVQMKRPIGLFMTTCANCCHDNKECYINAASNIAHLDEKKSELKSCDGLCMHNQH